MEWVQFYKKFSLYLTDHVSGELKIPFNSMDMSIEEKPYSDVATILPTYFFAGVFQLKDQQFVCVFEAKIVYALCNRMLGGNGLVETRPDDLFTPSESFFGNTLLDWVLTYYKKFNSNITLKRSEIDKKQFQSFFPSDTIEFATMSCKLHDKSIGKIYVCHKAKV